MKYILFLLLASNALLSWGQIDKINVQLSQLENGALNQTTFTNINVISTLDYPISATFNIQLKYRQLPYLINCKFNGVIQPGINTYNNELNHAIFTYSSQSLKELFGTYNKLPQGLYEYCVTAQVNSDNELAGKIFQECFYHKTEDLFSINLVSPDDKEEIYEYNPLLTWTANFPFISQLNYRVRLTEMKENQNAQSSIKRNPLLLDQKSIPAQSIVYPISATPLKSEQYYAWTVDAYYGDILLGGSEIWKFKIKEDSVLVATTKNPTYVDIRIEYGNYTLYAPGLLKFKYTVHDVYRDSLKLELLSDQGKKLKLPKQYETLSAILGENKYEILLHDEMELKHKHKYILNITNNKGEKYVIKFIYANPNYIK